MANKKALLLNMTNYYESLGQNVFDSLPVTFHVKNGLEDPEFRKFKAFYDQEEEALKIKEANKLNKINIKLNFSVVFFLYKFPVIFKMI